MSQMPHRYWLSEKRTASCFSPNSVWIPGDWMSVSTTPTRWPSAASSAATLAAAFDLPVPPRNEWTEMILDIGRSRDDVVDVLEIFLLEIVQAFPRQPGVDPGPQDHRVERFRQVVVRAHLDASDDALDIVKRGDHDDRRVPQLRLTSDVLE